MLPLLPLLPLLLLLLLLLTLFGAAAGPSSSEVKSRSLELGLETSAGCWCRRSRSWRAAFLLSARRALSAALSLFALLCAGIFFFCDGDLQTGMAVSEVQKVLAKWAAHQEDAVDLRVGEGGVMLAQALVDALRQRELQQVPDVRQLVLEQKPEQIVHLLLAQQARADPVGGGATGAQRAGRSRVRALGVDGVLLQGGAVRFQRAGHRGAVVCSRVHIRAEGASPRALAPLRPKDL